MIPPSSVDPSSKQGDDIPVGLEIKGNIYLLERGANSLETRYTARVLRNTSQFKSRLTPEVLKGAIDTYLSSGVVKQGCISALDPDQMAVDQVSQDSSGKHLPEIELYIGLLVLLYLYGQKSYDEGLKLSKVLTNRFLELKQRSLDLLASRIYFYYSQFHEHTGRLSEITKELLSVNCLVTLRLYTNIQAMLLNLLLRNYLHFNLYDQADKLVSKTVIPEFASNGQMARYMYYIGVIKAVQLDYTVARQHLLEAIRKTPQNKASAGFQQKVYKLLIILELLMGSIPDRSIFRLPMLREALIPYLEITRSVRVGDLARFKETLSTHGPTFLKDKTYTLILRLHHNVIKTAIRMISLAYTRISLRDIYQKLQLDSEEDAEYIVAKAIGEGAIFASIDHNNGYMQCKEVDDTYAANEPLVAYNERIYFCMKLHNGSIKALRFPSDTQNNELSNVAALREEERKIAQVIVEGELDDDDDMDGDW